MLKCSYLQPLWGINFPSSVMNNPSCSFNVMSSRLFAAGRRTDPRAVWLFLLLQQLDPPGHTGDCTQNGCHKQWVSSLSSSVLFCSDDTLHVSLCEFDMLCVRLSRNDARLETLKILLEAGNNPNLPRVPMPVLFLPIMASDTDGVAKLLMCGARTDIPLPPEVGNSCFTSSKGRLYLWQVEPKRNHMGDVPEFKQRQSINHQITLTSHPYCRGKAFILCTWLQHCPDQQVPKSQSCCSVPSPTQTPRRVTRTTSLNRIRCVSPVTPHNSLFKLIDELRRKCFHSCSFRTFQKAQETLSADEQPRLRGGGRTALHVACQSVGDSQVSTVCAHTHNYTPLTWHKHGSGLKHVVQMVSDDVELSLFLWVNYVVLIWTFNVSRKKTK